MVATGGFALTLCSAQTSGVARSRRRRTFRFGGREQTVAPHEGTAAVTASAAELGENVVDLEVDERGAVIPVLGRCPFTVARTMARLGLAPQFYSGLADDQFGHELRDALIADGVEVVIERPTANPTSLAFAQAHHRRVTYSFSLAGTAAFDVDATTTLAS